MTFTMIVPDGCKGIACVVVVEKPEALKITQTFIKPSEGSTEIIHVEGEE